MNVNINAYDKLFELMANVQSLCIPSKYMGNSRLLISTLPAYLSRTPSLWFVKYCTSLVDVHRYWDKKNHWTYKVGIQKSMWMPFIYHKWSIIWLKIFKYFHQLTASEGIHCRISHIPSVFLICLLLLLMEPTRIDKSCYRCVCVFWYALLF